MPVLQTIALKSPPTNAFGLYQYLAQRVPGYDISEYLRELNSSYIHVWEEVTKLKNHYFTNIKTVQVAVAQYSYDLMFNADGGLSSAVSPRLYQITKIRVLPPTGGLYQTTTPLPPSHPDFLSLNASPTSQPVQTGPYYWYMSGRNELQWALPLAVNSTIEVTYSFWPIALVILNNGTILSSGTAVTGNSTNFTNVCQPDFQAYLPSVQAQEEVQCELICNPGATLGGQIYRVHSITSDTALTTITPVAPTLTAGNGYVLATLPEIPREHLRVVASLALRNMYSIDSDDVRSEEWSGIAEKNIAMMKDSLQERQGQSPPVKLRFPYGIGRRNRSFLR
jgi:hypothetical protein